MPIIEIPNMTPLLVYDAPLDEKTKKLREQFKIDEETGYPEHYKWRNLAKLGKSYRIQDPFLKFEYPKEQDYHRSAALAVGAIGGCYMVIKLTSAMSRTPMWAKPHWIIGGLAFTLGLSLWIQEKSRERQALKNRSYIEYCEQHPERFTDIKRYKHREALTIYLPRR